MYAKRNKLQEGELTTRDCGSPQHEQTREFQIKSLRLSVWSKLTTSLSIKLYRCDNPGTKTLGDDS